MEISDFCGCPCSNINLLSGVPIELALPYPPSVNYYYRIYKGRPILTAAARTFRARCSAIIKRAYAGIPFKAPCSVMVRLFRPRATGDADNRIKPILDALQGLVYDNDSQVQYVSICKSDDKARPRAEVWVLPHEVTP